MAGLGGEQLWQRQVEHPDGVLHQDILFVVVAAFHSAAVLVVAYCAVALGIRLVAICLGICGFIAGIYRAAVYSESEVSNFKAFELLLSSDYILCTSSVVRMG